MLEAAAVLSTHSHVHAPSTIHVACCTWNVGNCAPDEANMGAWLVENCKPGADLYAVGVMLLEVLVGHRVFDGTGAEMLQAKRSTEQLPKPPPWAPKELAELARALMSPNPADRPNQWKSMKTDGDPWKSMKIDSPADRPNQWKSMKNRQNR